MRNIRNLIFALIRWFYLPFGKYIPWETFRYGATGGLNLVLDIVLYAILYNFILRKQILQLGFVAISPHIAAFLIVFPITFTTGFFMARYITFTSSTLRGKIQLFRYVLSVGGAIILNYLLLKLFVEYLHFWPTIAKMFTTIVVVTYSYLFQRYFTFKTGTLLRRNR